MLVVVLWVLGGGGVGCWLVEGRMWGGLWGWLGVLGVVGRLAGAGSCRRVTEG